MTERVGVLFKMLLFLLSFRIIQKNSQKKVFNGCEKIKIFRLFYIYFEWSLESEEWIERSATDFTTIHSQKRFYPCKWITRWILTLTDAKPVQLIPDIYPENSCILKFLIYNSLLFPIKVHFLGLKTYLMSPNDSEWQHNLWLSIEVYLTQIFESIKN